jgi:cell division protein FtsW
MAIGTWMSVASTPSVAVRIGLPAFYFFSHHIVMIPIGVIIIATVSLLRVTHICRLSLFIYLGCIVLLICVLFFGTEIKGAKRWINLFFISLQPSEILKPALTILNAWFISEQYRDNEFPGILLSTLSVGLTCILLLLQPDIGMTVIIVLTWMAQLFVSGMSIFIIVFSIALCLIGSIGLYYVFPHFHGRVDKFLDKRTNLHTDFYQVQKSLEAFKNGGLFGKGPGEGVVKAHVPDIHSDFVFSVVGEEFGFILCLTIIVLFFVIIVRSLLRVMQSSSLFSYSAGFGIIVQFTAQILINISVSLNLIPTKGIPLPFISYGRSSFLASSLSIGILLLLTKKSSISGMYGR